MIVYCKSVSVNGSFINENGQQENLYDLELNCYGDSASAMTQGTNIDGTPCFTGNGRFNGMKIAPFSVFCDCRDGSSKPVDYWNYELQKWGE